ncbi:hypothetical protein L6164_029178 [Bauhinia variegata]|uniref:Uncharacterized protein n=1 Tax=Bauhinia variegata TaxID=167791 RepID=A0ACB9L8T8_BAUVA|nr:hypothetical protein L6164_029178 [Bauhinia variegata]
MADRVHPHSSPPDSGEARTTTSGEPELSRKPTSPSSDKPVPTTGTYVIQIPKDQVYRVPPRENSRRYNQYGRRKQRRGGCCCCLCWLLGFIVILIVLLGITAGVLYLVFRPEAPDYTVNRIAVKGMNLTSALSSGAISPEFDVAVRANNPNDKIGIYYEKDSSVEIYYNDVRLCNGALPAFYQPSNNVTVFEMALKGSSIELRSTDSRALVDAQNKGKVPLNLKIRAPVKIEVGSVKTWRITVKVDCDITVDKLAAQAKIVSKTCDYGVDIWP